MARDEAYRKAEKKIEEARRSGAKELDLSNPQWRDPKPLQLTELPESLGQLTQLQTLDLSNNQLTALPEWLGQLTQLQSLDLSRNQLAALPAWLGQFTQLQNLALSFNQLMALPEWLGKLTQLHSLDLFGTGLTMLPEWLGEFTQLRSLDLNGNQLTTLPESLGQLTQLQELNIAGNQLTVLPECLGQLTRLRILAISWNGLRLLPDWISNLENLRELYAIKNEIERLPDAFGNLKQLRILALGGREIASRWIFGEKTGEHGNKLTSLPLAIVQLSQLKELNLDDNPLNPELAAAYKEGLDAVKLYLRLKVGPQVILNEAKLILIGEGEVGKSCLLGALRDDEWEEGRPTTHGIEIKPVKVSDPESGKEITLNGWDFGGQRVYRPTHQLFFSAPAVYVVVWKPREGPQQGFVKEWIKLIKHREPEAKILVVATHGGPGGRQPDIDRQELWDLFGKDTVLDFFHVESKPDENGVRRGIEELKQAIARVAASLPEMGRTVPKRWQEAREALQQTSAAYLPLERVLELCHDLKMDDDEARLFVTISHRLGHLIHYEHDPALRDIVVLKPDWLATAMSFVLDDEQTRNSHGLVSFTRLNQLWNDPARAEEFRYPPELHPVFLRLMERFDLSYRVAGLPVKGQSGETSLIAQLVPDNRPDPVPSWEDSVASGDAQQEQICRIVDARNGQSATAEGLFYQLIVRLHKFSLGRVNYNDSVHWQRGLVLDDDYNGRALLEHVGNDVRIIVRAAYPERFLSVLTSEVKYLVDSFWIGLRCEVMVPCIEPCGKRAPGTGLFEVQKLIESARKSRPEYPCPVCNEWQEIDHLLRNAPAARAAPIEALISESADVKRGLAAIYQQLRRQHADIMGRFDQLDASDKRLLSRVDDAFTGLMQALTDEAKEGPRLFSLVPVDRTVFNPKQWTSAKFRLTLWCEHSRLPLPNLNGKGSKKGVYELELTREWFKKAAPFLKVLTGTLSLVLPIASSAVKLALDDTAYKAIEEELDFGKDCINASLEGSEKIGGWLGGSDAPSLEHGEAIRAQGGMLRELQALLKAKDPGFGGLVRVQNKRQEFLWVHPQFEKEY
jgi:Leucine-rich repeat (LRR) protein